MLQFWKKEKQKSPHSSPSKFQNGSTQVVNLDREESASVGPLSNFKHDSINRPPCEKKSRLSLELEDVLNNKIALSYFSQYMESRGYTNILSLWFEVEQVPFPLHAFTHSHKRLHSLTGSPLKLPTPSTGHSSETDKGCEDKSGSVKLIKLLRTYLNDDAPFRIRIPEELRVEISDCVHSGGSPECLSHLRDHLIQTMKKEVWSDFLRSDWHCKYQVEVMTSGAMTLSDVLYNDQCLSSFIEFLEQEDLLCVIEFWLAATSFEKQFMLNDPLDSNQIQNDAIIIYDRYLSLQATTPLGIGDRVRFAVEESICGELATSPKCFERAVVAVEALMRSAYLRPFLSSQHYLGLLSEVMSTTSRSNHSPASSVTEGSLDTRPPPDPDDLWRRRRQNSGLSFGRIDQLGRYETDIEPEPKAESRISRVVKMLISRDEQKTQEEMAWRVAEMIVKDITSITMGSSRDDIDDDDS